MPGIKRAAEYVPSQYRRELTKLSKSDLMEIAYQFALRMSGEDNEDMAYSTVATEYRILCANDGRTPIKIK